MRARTMAAIFAAIVAIGWAGVAAAQVEDFATCGPDLVACDEDNARCCYRSFDRPSPTDAGAIVIPMDRCHQRVGKSGTDAPPGPDSPAWCQDPLGSADEGMFQAYGLVYRLLQNDIPVHWVINPTKDPAALTASENLKSQTYTERDIDAWILGASATRPPPVGTSLTSCGAGCEAPVERLDPATLAPLAGSYSAAEFPLRGGAFVIAPDDRERFDAFWNKTDEFEAYAGQSKYDFSAVDLYEITSGSSFVYQDFRTAGPNYGLAGDGASAPIAITLDYQPPRLARQSPAGVSEIWLGLAKLDDPADHPSCLTGEFAPADAVFCDMTEEQVRQGYLVDGDFRWAWLDNYKDNSPCGDDAEIEQQVKLEEFLTEDPGIRPAGNVMLMEAAVGVSEECTDHEFMGAPSIGLATLNQTPEEPLILRHPQNLFMQWGDLPAKFASGSVGKWRYYGDGALGYDSILSGSEGSLMRLVTEDQSGAGNALCTNHVSTASCDVFEDRSDADTVDAAAYARYDNSPQNGIVFYMAGNNVNGRQQHLRMILNAFISLPTGLHTLEPGDPVEVSRSSPIVATVDGVEAQYMGSFETHEPAKPVTTYGGSEDDDTFQFPYKVGHLRAVPTSEISSGGDDFDELSEAALFDAADAIPTPNPDGCGTPFSGSCRTVFTHTEGGQRPERVFFDRSNVEALQPILAPELTVEESGTLISRVLAGYDDGSGGYVPKLGGVDRSTPAVIEPSPLIGTERPTMVYVGGHDGMLHAICADTVGPCDAQGQELWAFLPRTQLPVLKENRQRIDGSPKIADVFGDFDGDGLRQWRTVLTFQTGSGEPGFGGKQPGVFALDITEPDDPRILWEVTTAETRGDFALGVGIGQAMGRVRVDGDLKNATFIQTNNGGTGGPGFYLAAIDTITGEYLWRQGHLYPAPRDEGNPPVPSTGIPAGVAAVDRDDAGAITDLVVPSLYGDMWMVDATDGSNAFGTSGERPLDGSPLLRFTEDHHPVGATPTVYRDRTDGQLYAVAVSGGYVDPNGSSWAPPGTDQYAVSVSLATVPGAAPITEAGDDSGGLRSFSINIGTNRAYSQAVIAGNELFIVTDSDDINSSSYGTSGSPSGLLSRYSLGGGGLDAGAQIGDSTEIRGGAGSVDVREGVVYSGAGDGAQKTDVSADHDSEGSSVEVAFTQRTTRKLWLRAQ